ncbi:MAG: aldehyde ferredoxin oxidoreductase N-terminal domain-containing protein [Dehalococcoidales bacterium]|nr:aldehyde ferredoxin oxidoreductase N-terminal domain-containing protein [Dehalococcoidales bacterium]
MTSGFTGKILRVNLTNQTTSIINTKKYEEYAGGLGIGTAIFWDLAADKLPMDAFDPGNIVSIMGSPFSGTMVPSSGGRTEVTGIGPQSYPIGWHTRSNFGGRFSGELKYAGWDGVVIEGKASSPIWINIINDRVTFEDAGSLWGLDAWTTQEEIWREAIDKARFGERSATGDAYAAQRPAVLCIGLLGEVMAKDLGCLIHDKGNSAGQGGFGAVFGSKNLKAISVLGTRSIEIPVSDALLEARRWAHSMIRRPEDLIIHGTTTGIAHKSGYNDHEVQYTIRNGHQGCQGCHYGCRKSTQIGKANKSQCVEKSFYYGPNVIKYGGFNNQIDKASDVVQRYGANAYPLNVGLMYLFKLYNMGIMGKGKAIDTDLPFELFGDAKFVEILLEKIVKGEGIGLDLRDGFVRAAEKWGRKEEDMQSGLLNFSYWGCPEHMYDPRTEIYWGYGSIIGERDINEHDLNDLLYWNPLTFFATGDFPVSAEETATICAEKLIPYVGDPFMLDFSEENMYSEHIAKLVAWHRHYTSFWKQSTLFCDWAWANIINVYSPNNRGMTPEGEPKFYNAVTNKNLSFADGMEIGRKIWNMRNAIWTLQGRHRDIVYYADYLYSVPYEGLYPQLTYINGKWDFTDVSGKCIDRTKFDEWKTKFYEIEGWDTSTGWPTRATLEGLGLKNVADLLESKGKLGG